MLLSPQVFRDQLEHGSLRIAFLGMSNIGKTYRSRQLSEEKGFNRISLDEEIGKVFHRKNEASLAEWMGLPNSPGFSERQQEYLNHEERLTKESIEKASGNIILDTTGSVIYLSEETLRLLRSRFLVIVLEATADMKETMMTAFFQNPKPLVWGDAFSPLPGEETESALRRCYPHLLAFRQKKYQALADICLPGTISRNQQYTAQDFWEIIISALSTHFPHAL